MSLSTWIRVPEVRERLDAITPPYQRILGIPLLVTPDGSRHTIGVAFDYALRFSLQKRCRAARGILVAEIGAVLIEKHLSRSGKRHLQTLRQRVGRTYNGSLDDLLVDTLRLAQLDVVRRAGPAYFDEASFIEPSPVDQAQVRALLGHVPWKRFEHKRLRLNPTFGEYSFLVGGADADVISGDRLIEVKTVANAWVEREYTRQAVGYALLERWASHGRTSIKRVEIYFSRHATFYGFDVEDITARSKFKQHETWLRRHIHYGLVPLHTRDSEAS